MSLQMRVQGSLQLNSSRICTCCEPQLIQDVGCQQCPEPISLTDLLQQRTYSEVKGGADRSQMPAGAGMGRCTRPSGLYLSACQTCCNTEQNQVQGHQLISNVCRGGYGAVYKAKYLPGDQIVAIKVGALPPHCCMCDHCMPAYCCAGDPCSSKRSPECSLSAMRL